MRNRPMRNRPMRNRPMRNRPMRNRAMHWSVAMAALVGAAALVALIAVGPRPAAAAPGPPPAPTTSAAAGAEDPVRAAELLFEAGRYAEGRTLLVDASAEHRRDHREYARLLVALCAFYERYVGDFRRVAGYLREIDNLKLAPDDPALQTARATRARLAELDAPYSKENAILSRAAGHEPDRQALQIRADELAALIARQPTYPRLAAAHHYLGETYLRLEEFRKAYRAFEQALELRPAIDFALPTTRRQAEALERWARRDLSRGSRALLASLWVLGVVLLARSRPWRWLGLRHALALGVLAGSWWLTFRVGIWLLGGTVPDDLSSLPAPVYLQTALGTPLAGPLDQLFGYGLVAVAGAFVIALLTTQYRPRWTAVVGGGAAMLLLLSCLMTQFVLEQRSASFQPAGEGRYRYLRGAFLYPLSAGQEPYLLTEPKSYCGFQETVDVMDEPETKGWFVRYAKLCR